MRIGCLGGARYVLGRILVPVAADDERRVTGMKYLGHLSQELSLDCAHAAGVVGGIVGVAYDETAAVGEAEGSCEQAALEVEHADRPGETRRVLPS